MESDSSSGDENRPLRRRERKGKLRRRRRRVRCDVNFSDSSDDGGNADDDVTTEKKAAPVRPITSFFLSESGCVGAVVREENEENDVVDSGLASSNFKITDFFGASRLSKSLPDPDETTLPDLANGLDSEESELPSVADELKQQTILFHKKDKAKAPPTSPCNDDENSSHETGFEIVERTHSQRTCAAAILYPSNVEDVLMKLETVQQNLTTETRLPLIVNVVIDEKNAAVNAETTSMEEDSVDEDYRKIMEWEERALNGRRGEIDGGTRSPLFENAECVSDDENHSLTHGPASVSEKEKSQSDAQEEEFHSMPSRQCGDGGRKRKKRRQVLPVKYEEESPPPPPDETNDVRLDSSPPPREVATSSASDVETAFVRRRRGTRKASVVHVDVTEASRRQKTRKSESKQAKLDRRVISSSSSEEEAKRKKTKKRKTPSSTADEKKEEPVTARNKRKGKAPRKYCPILVDPDPSEVKNDDDDDVKEIEADGVVPAVQLRNALNLVTLLPESELRKKNRAATAASLPDFVPFPEISHVLQLEEEETNSAEPRGDVKFIDAVSALESERCRSLLPNEFTSSASKAGKSEKVFLNKEISNSLSEELEKLSTEHPSIECSILYDSLSKRATAAKQSADLPWADEFAPRHSSEIIANTEAVERMRSWLMEWQGQPSADPPVVSSPPSSPPIEQETKKKRRKRVTERFPLDDDDDFVVLKNRYVDYDDDDDEEVEDEGPCKAIVLVGPHGSGKTAAVYACAEELGLKVLPVPILDSKEV